MNNSMFRIVSIISFLIVLVLIIRGFTKQPENSPAIKRWLRLQRQAVFNRGDGFTSLNYVKSFFYLLAVLAVLIMAFTGFLPVIFLGKHLSGILMILHVTTAPVLAVSLALLSLFYAQRNIFTQADLESLGGRQRGKEETSHVNIERIIAMKKIFFWLLIALSIPLIASILLSMFNIYGTSGQSFLLHLHGYTALFFVIVAMAYAYFSILQSKS